MGKEVKNHEYTFTVGLNKRNRENRLRFWDYLFTVTTFLSAGILIYNFAIDFYEPLFFIARREENEKRREEKREERREKR